MRNKKGFTLIELLAVIVILAIIALIAVPIVLNMIDSARKSAAKSSTYGFIEAIEYNNGFAETEQEGYTKIEDGNYKSINDFNNVKMKGKIPSSVDVTIENSKVTAAELCIDNYKVIYNGREVTSVVRGCGEITPIYPTVLEKVKTLVYENNTCKTDGSTYNYMGGCYIKGASTNNYVWYNGFMWRIMGINSDGTIRLITDENITTISYGETDPGDEIYYQKEGYVNDWLNNYFYSHLNNSKNIIKKGNYFCNQRESDSTVNGTTCTTGNEVNTKIGIISINEYVLAGGYLSYLNINQNSWTMSEKYKYAFLISTTSDNSASSAINNLYGVRPVINVESTATFTKGDGTIANYYILSEDKNGNIKGTLGDKSTSGEYVKLNNKIYRVVAKDSEGVKLILDGYYETTTDGITSVYETQFNPSGTNSSTFENSTLDTLLNTDVLTWLGNSNKIVTSSLDQGLPMRHGYSYLQSLTDKGTSINRKVGLIKIGEMLSSQSSTILTKNYTVSSSNENTKEYWTTTNYHTSFGYGSGNIFAISEVGKSTDRNATWLYAVRPVIKVINSANIIKGNGTWNNPYEI